MSSPESQQILDSMVALGERIAAAEPTVENSRRLYDEWLTSHAPAPQDLEQQATSYGGVRCLSLTTPGSAPSRTVLYLHGGGYLLGNPDSYTSIAAAISRLAEAEVVSADYSLAPENPHPAALLDAHRAYRALAAERGAGNLVVCGDSAGGGLALALLLAIREAGDRLPAAAVAMSPWTDLTLSGDSVTTNAALDPTVSFEGLQAMATAYLQGADPEQPSASPLFGDLSGLPPLLLIAGQNEALRDDAIRFADRASAAGGDVTLDVVDGMFHAFPITPDAFPEARDACAEIADFIRCRPGRAG